MFETPGHFVGGLLIIWALGYEDRERGVWLPVRAA
jgi:hypothetical protein